MAALAGAIRQWQSLPFPIRLAGIFLAGMAMIWLTRRYLSDGGVRAVVRRCVSLLHASGRLGWVDRYPWAARILDGFAPRLSMSTPVPATGSPAPTTAPAPLRRGEVRERAAPPAIAVDISRFIGGSQAAGDTCSTQRREEGSKDCGARRGEAEACQRAADDRHAGPQSNCATWCGPRSCAGEHRRVCLSASGLRKLRLAKETEEVKEPPFRAVLV
jgi:hypothetical protein